MLELNSTARRGKTVSGREGGRERERRKEREGGAGRERGREREIGKGRDRSEIVLRPNGSVCDKLTAWFASARARARGIAIKSDVN